ncbi:MAG: alpha-L-fucosidase, partial [bacterium]|nr:alpha-L-fucosidase [bacterium]
YPQDAAVFDMERGQLARICPTLWQNDTSVCKKSWGYIEDHDYKTPTTIIGDLVDVISKNGALLLNVCPRPDGTIPEAQQSILWAIGRWLNVNGEAIYGTRPWKVFGEGPTEVVEGGFSDTKRDSFTNEDFRFTRKADALYAIALGWPNDGRLVIRTLAEGSTHAPHHIADVALLGSDAPLKWTRDKESLTIDLPPEQPCEHAWVLRIR